MTKYLMWDTCDECPYVMLKPNRSGGYEVCNKRSRKLSIRAWEGIDPDCKEDDAPEAVPKRTIADIKKQTKIERLLDELGWRAVRAFQLCLWGDWQEKYDEIVAYVKELGE